MKTIAFETYLTLIDTEDECDEPQVEVTANLIPESPIVWRTANGDGHPGDPAEIEVTKIVRLDTGEEIEWDSLSPYNKERLDEVANKNACDSDADYEEREY